MDIFVGEGVWNMHFRLKNNFVLSNGERKWGPFGVMLESMEGSGTHILTEGRGAEVIRIVRFRVGKEEVTSIYPGMIRFTVGVCKGSEWWIVLEELVN